MNYSDPLEKTEDADDISGANNCPVWMRITAIGKYDIDQRVSIVNGPSNNWSGKADSSGRGRGYKAIKCWIEINGKKETIAQIGEVAKTICIRRNTLQKHRTKAMAKGLDEAETNGIRWGWTFDED